MYIWIILATFLAVLASYTLSIRPDMRSVTVEPVAEAALGKMIVQHKAAKTYVRYNKYPYTAERNKVEYYPGIIADEDIAAELPIGFAVKDGYYYGRTDDDYHPYGYELSGDYTSQIFCMSADMSESYLMTGGINPCDDTVGRRMLVTYGPIPKRWLLPNSAAERPNADLMNAMRTMVDVGERLGYIAPADANDVEPSEDNPSGSDVRLIDRNGTAKVFVPRAVVEDSSFKARCDVSKGESCLVYMSGI